MTLPTRPPRYINFFEPFRFTAGDQLVVPIGASHISLSLQEIQSREREKKEQTNNMLGLTQVPKGNYVTVCICRLTLAWVSSENSTTLLECRLIFPHCSGPHLIRLVSQLRCRLVTPLSLANCFLELLCPTLWPAFPSYFWSSKISSPKPFVWFFAKTDKGIVCLADHLHSVTRSFQNKALQRTARILRIVLET